jgi:hypothetical protein
MDRVLEGGTDAGSMVIFDPAALPDEFDTILKSDPAEQLEDLMEVGRLYWLNTMGDGGYTLGVYVGDRLPEHVEPYSKQMDAFEVLHLPSGRLFFAGVEYVFQSDDSALRKYPHMGEFAELQPGRYRAEFFEFEYPEDFHERLLRQQLPATQFRAHQLMNALAPIGCISLLGVIASLVWLRWGTVKTIIVVCLLALIALPMLLSRLPSYRRASVVYKNIQKEFCDYGVLLHSLEHSIAPAMEEGWLRKAP